jgi:iron complex outermembrane recepter protein
VVTGDRFPLVPTHASSLGVDASLPKAVSLGINARYTGRRFLRGDEANDEPPLDGYWVADARIGVHVGGWELHAIARNVFDSRHATFATFNINQGAGSVLERFLTPGSPRTVQVTLRRSFGR